MNVGANSYSNTTKSCHTAFATGTKKSKKMQINKKSDLLILNAAMDTYITALHSISYEESLQKYKNEVDELAVRIIKELEKK